MTRSHLRKALRLLEHALAAIGVAWICQTYVVEVSVTTTSCMAPLLVGRDRAGARADWVVTDKLLGARSVPRERFSVVSLEDDEGFPIVKRVVAFAGEAIALRRDRTLLIDGRVVEAPPEVGRADPRDPHGYLPCGNLADEQTFLVPAGHVYVLGDDTNDAQDSRFIGAVPAEKIRGRVLVAFRLWDRWETL